MKPQGCFPPQLRMSEGSRISWVCVCSKQFSMLQSAGVLACNILDRNSFGKDNSTPRCLLTHFMLCRTGVPRLLVIIIIMAIDHALLLVTVLSY